MKKLRIMNYELKNTKYALRAMLALFLNFTLLIHNFPAQAQLPPYGQPILLNLDRALRSTGPLDQNTTNPPSFYVGDDVEMDVNLFSAGVLIQTNLIVKYTNVEMQVFLAQNDTNPPQMQLIVTNTAFFTNLFAAGAAPGGTNNYPTNYQVQFYWPGDLTQLDLNGQASQYFWFRCFATGTNGVIATFGEGPIQVLNAPISALSPALTFGQSQVVVSSSTAAIVSPPTFFSANSNLLNASVNPPSLAAITNLIATNLTSTNPVFWGVFAKHPTNNPDANAVDTYYDFWFDATNNIIAEMAEGGRLDLLNWGNNGAVIALNNQLAPPQNDEILGHYAWRGFDNHTNADTFAAIYGYALVPNTNGLYGQVQIQVLDAVKTTNGDAQPNLQFQFDYNGLALPGVPLDDQTGVLTLGGGVNTTNQYDATNNLFYGYILALGSITADGDLISSSNLYIAGLGQNQLLGSLSVAGPLTEDSSITVTGTGQNTFYGDIVLFNASTPSTTDEAIGPFAFEAYDSHTNADIFAAIYGLALSTNTNSLYGQVQIQVISNVKTTNGGVEPNIQFQFDANGLALPVGVPLDSQGGILTLGGGVNTTNQYYATNNFFYGYILSLGSITADGDLISSSNLYVTGTGQNVLFGPIVNTNSLLNGFTLTGTSLGTNSTGFPLADLNELAQQGNAITNHFQPTNVNLTYLSSGDFQIDASGDITLNAFFKMTNNVLAINSPAGTNTQIGSSFDIQAGTSFAQFTNGVLSASAITAEGPLLTPSVSMSTTNVDGSKGNLFYIALGANKNFLLTNIYDGWQGTVWVTNSGANAITWLYPSGYNFTLGNSSTSPAANKQAVFSFICFLTNIIGTSVTNY
jgi:hypothetical protein